MRLQASQIPFSRTYRPAFTGAIGIAAAYRGFFFLQFFFQLFPLLTQLLLWNAVYSQGAAGMRVGGFGRSQMFTYFFLMNLLGLANSSPWEMSADIRQGKLNQFLLKPIHYALYQWHMLLGRISIELLYQSLPAAVLLLFARHLVVLPAEAWRWPAFLFSLFLGIQIGFLVSFLIGCCAFWVLENSSFLHVLMPIQMLLEGGWFPLSLLPAPLFAVLSSLPFAYQTYFPATIFLGSADPARAVQGLATQCLWVLALGALSWLLWRRGTRAYCAVGG